MTQYHIMEYNDKVPTTNILKSTETNTIAGCALEFMATDDDCSAMFYNEDDRRCILVSQLESPSIMSTGTAFVVFADFRQCKYFINLENNRIISQNICQTFPTLLRIIVTRPLNITLIIMIIIK